MKRLAFTVTAALIGLATPPRPAAEVDGAAKAHQTITLTFTGPAAAATDVDANPFLDRRLQVRFDGPEGRSYDVPGFFDGDGRGGARGDRWRVRFTPDRPGRWSYRASFRAGPGVAVDLAPDAGEAVAIDGAEGAIEVGPIDPAAPAFHRWGRLGYAGSRYLKFAEGPYWIKGGCDEPENFLAYAGFANTPPSHSYADHAEDWRPGDPDWNDGDGRAIVGAINHLASKHVNSLYFLTMNVGGDGKDVWPWVGRPARDGAASDDNLHFDVAKLAQWEAVFAHAQRRGIVLHFVLNEAEEANKRELDDGELGVERKLYYRELVARFGHHPALQWNLCEEYNIGGLDLGPDRVRAFAGYLRAIDPYDHPITVHSAGDPRKALAFTFGDPAFDLTSVQLNQRRIDVLTEDLLRATKAAGRVLPIAMDEFTVDKGTNASHIPVDDPVLHRKQKLWPTYLSGGSIEFILEGLLKVDSFKTPARDDLWDFTWYARSFLEALPFWEMEPDDGLSRGAATIAVGVGKGETTEMGAQVLAAPGRVYAIYLPRADRTGEIDLRAASGPFSLRWYNPRLGRFEGDPRRLEGGAWADLGPPPASPEEDWTALVKAADRSEWLSRPFAFPGESWEPREPAALGLRADRLDAFAKALGGRGCVVKDGYVVKAWGDQAARGDVFSSAKPMLGTLLLFAMKEGKVRSLDQPVRDFGWELSPKDRAMTLRHLTTMTSGYARPERPGEAWAYNDFAIQLYQKTLFDRIYRDDPGRVAADPARLGALGLEDGLEFRSKNRRIKASPRDFARIAWFWLNRGAWGGAQILPRAAFDDVMRPQVPRDLPLTRPAETDDYLGIGSYGGGSDHFSQAGPGVYGFNWWFNAPGRDAPDRNLWPDAPDDAFLAAGARGNNAVMLPSLGAVAVALEADWGEIDGSRPDSKLNARLAQLAEAVGRAGP